MTNPGQELQTMKALPFQYAVRIDLACEVEPKMLQENLIASLDNGSRTSFTVSLPLLMNTRPNPSPATPDEQTKDAFYAGAEWAIENHPAGSEYSWYQFSSDVNKAIADYMKALLEPKPSGTV